MKRNRTEHKNGQTNEKISNKQQISKTRLKLYQKPIKKRSQPKKSNKIRAKKNKMVFICSFKSLFSFLKALFDS